MAAIKSLVELGPPRVSPQASDMSFFKDANQIDRRYWGVILQDRQCPFSNMARAFGNTDMLRPKTPATRAEMAAMLAQFGDYTSDMALANKAKGLPSGPLRQGGPRGEGFSGGGPPGGGPGGPPGGANPAPR